LIEIRELKKTLFVWNNALSIIFKKKGSFNILIIKVMREYDKVNKLLINEMESLEVLNDLKSLSTKFNLPKEVTRLEMKIGKRSALSRHLKKNYRILSLSIFN
jgi:hypothetical protein